MFKPLLFVVAACLCFVAEHASALEADSHNTGDCLDELRALSGNPGQRLRCTTKPAVPVRGDRALPPAGSGLPPIFPLFDMRIPCPTSTIDPITWIPRCGALLGANREKVGALQATMAAHELLLGGRALDLVHTFKGVAVTPTLTADEIAMIGAGQRFFVNFKPASSWLAASGGSATVNTRITQFAQSIASVKPARVMVTIHHEPENEIDAAAGRSAADYVSMWHNVRAIFNAQGATNTIWAWNVMGYPPTRPLLKSLWPGNAYVDWVTWNDYVRTKATTDATPQFVDLLEDMYAWLEAASDESFNVKSKPWGLGEWGVGIETSFINGVLDCGYAATAAKQSLEFVDLGVALDATPEKYGRLKLLTVFDNRCAKIVAGSEAAYATFANSRFMKQLR